MGQITLQIPQTGQLFSTEGPKVATDLTLIQTLLNGNLDSTNLSASPAVARSQLAGGFGNLAWSLIAGNTSAVDGTFYNLVGANGTITLPTPTVNRTVGVRCGGSGTFTATVSAGAAKIFGVGCINVSSITLGTDSSYAVFQADGSSWYIVAGQQDTGWVALTLGTGIVAAPVGYTPSARLCGNMVLLSGVLKNNTGGTASIGTLLATVPSFAIPAQQSFYSAMETAAANSGGAQIEKVGDANPGGILNANTIAAAHNLSLDGWQYRLT